MEGGLTWRKVLTAPLRGLKAAFEMRWSGQHPLQWFWMPRTSFDYAGEVGDGTSSNIVVSTVNWIARTFPEALPRVIEEGADGNCNPVPQHPMVRRLERPNSFYSGVLLWMATIVDWAFNGNAYWLKVRNRAGQVIELWWAPSSTMEPRWPESGKVFISHYEYKPTSFSMAKVDPEDVVHFRYGLDPQNPRKGLSQLKSLVREIFTDEEAANFTASLLRNLGVPGVVLSPEGIKVSREDAEQVKEQYMAKFGGDRRGEPMVMQGPTKVQVLSFSPEQLLLKELRRIPEERVTAVFGVAAVVVGLGAGLDRSTFLNFHEAREAAYEGNIIPTQRLMAADLQIQLMPDFETDENRRVEFDITRVRVLQPDMDKLFERMNRAVLGGWATLADARRAVSLPATAEHEIYLRPLNSLEVPSRKGLTEQKGLKDEHPFAQQMVRLRARLVERFEGEIRRFFEGQANRVMGRLEGVANVRGANGARFKQAFSADTLLPAEEDTRLIAVLKPLWLAGIASAWNAAADAFGLDTQFEEGKAATVAATLIEAERRARRINQGARRHIGDALTLATQRGYTVQQIALGVSEDEFDSLPDRVESYYAGRQGTIALTESMWATNEGTILAYRDSGFERVQLVDGGTDAPCVARNGSIVSLEVAEAAMGAEHPNGTLTMVPV